MNYILAYDLGTGGLKASLFDEDGKARAGTFRPCDTYYPGTGFREQAPNDWWQILMDSTKELLAGRIHASDIACISMSGHSLGVVPVGKDGLLSDRVPIWSDSRAEKEAQIFFRRIGEEEWYLTTGNGFHAPLYSIFKMMWLKQHESEIYARTEKFVGTKDYLNYKLTGRIATDYSYASGSGVFDLRQWKYKEDYIEASGIEKTKLAVPAASTAIVGKVSREAAALTGLLEGTPVVCGGVDNSCMALGAGCFGEGEAYTSLGTSAWVAASSAEPIVESSCRPYVFAHCVPDMYVSATAIYSAGSAFAWLRDVMCQDLVAEQKKHGINAYDAMTRLAAESPVGANGILFNPSLAGGSSLDKNPDLRGAFVGLDLRHTRADMIRAVLEGICMNLRLAMDVLSRQVDFRDDMLIVGGGGKSAFWRQLFASIYNKNITQIAVGQDAGALGAAALGAVGVGLWDDFDRLRDICAVKSYLKPIPGDNAQYEKILPVFQKIAENQCVVAELMAEMK
ncbi:MAG: FGGY-family carbohydrate kinase [Lachnospiraceae bacterium]|nr:FGGY-family carbohydrate kinase [Lachnospiraceae bacterium]